MEIRALVFAVVLTMGASSAVAETLLERGDYLINGIVACGNCHTPQTPTGPAPGMEMAGQFLVEEKGLFKAFAPNITQDKKTGTGGWTDQQIIMAIREGKRPDGTIIGPPMPIGLYRGLSDRNVRAIVAYLRQVTPFVKGRPDFANQLGAGGFAFHGPWGVSVSANITPHADGIADYGDAELAKVIRSGVRPDGSRLMPPMGVYYYANISDGDMAAIIAYLRALEAKPNPN